MQRSDAFVAPHYKLIDSHDPRKYTHGEGAHEILVRQDIKRNRVSWAVQRKDHDQIERQEP